MSDGDEALDDLMDSLGSDLDRARLARELSDTPDWSGGLLDRTARAHVLADRLGLYRPPKTQIGRLVKGGVVDVEGTITRIDPVKTFRRKNGGEGQLVNIHIDDGTGSCRLVIFDWKLIDELRAGHFTGGQRVRAIGVSPQDKGYGPELRFSRGSQLIPLEEPGLDEPGHDGPGGGEGPGSGTGAPGEEENDTASDTVKESLTVEGILVSVSEPRLIYIMNEKTELIRLMVFDGGSTVAVEVPSSMAAKVEMVGMERRLRISGLSRHGDVLRGMEGVCRVEATG